MKFRIRKANAPRLRIAATLAFCFGIAFPGGGTLQAQDNQTDALIQILIRKGILTQEEAADIKSEVAAISEPSPQAPAVVNRSSPDVKYIPMPSNLDSLKLYGDARFRYQYENARSQSGNNNDRSRWRYRARFGADYIFKDSAYSMGLRLETGESNDSTNVNYGGFFDKTGDSIGIGLLYLNYKGEDWNITLGKHKNPFMISGAFWDSDINPEGISESYQSGAWTHTFGQYVIDEENESKQTSGGPRVDDDYLFVAQSKWTNGEGLSIAPMIFGTTGGVSTASESAGFKGENGIKNFNNMFIAALPFEYKFKTGGQSQTLFGTWGINLEGDDAINDPSSPFYGGGPGMSSRNQFFNLGYKNGSAKKTGQWEWGVEYRYIEAASITPNLSDSDFAKNHTNQHGIVFSSKYAVTDFFTTGLTLIVTEEIDDAFTSPVANSGDVDMVQLDASVKF